MAESKVEELLGSECGKACVWGGSNAGVWVAMGRTHGLVVLVAVCGVGWYGAEYVVCTWSMVGGAGGDRVGVFVRGSGVVVIGLWSGARVGVGEALCVGF